MLCSSVTGLPGVDQAESYHWAFVHNGAFAWNAISPSPLCPHTTFLGWWKPYPFLKVQMPFVKAFPVPWRK